MQRAHYAIVSLHRSKKVVLRIAAWNDLLSVKFRVSHMKNKKFNRQQFKFDVNIHA